MFNSRFYLGEKVPLAEFRRAIVKGALVKDNPK
jgi:hypothetical protein